MSSLPNSMNLQAFGMGNALNSATPIVCENDISLPRIRSNAILAILPRAISNALRANLSIQELKAFLATPSSVIESVTLTNLPTAELKALVATLPTNFGAAFCANLKTQILSDTYTSLIKKVLLKHSTTRTVPRTIRVPAAKDHSFALSAMPTFGPDDYSFQFQTRSLAIHGNSCALPKTTLDPLIPFPPGLWPTSNHVDLLPDTDFDDIKNTIILGRTPGFTIQDDVESVSTLPVLPKRRRSQLRGYPRSLKMNRSRSTTHGTFHVPRVVRPYNSVPDSIGHLQGNYFLITNRFLETPPVNMRNIVFRRRAIRASLKIRRIKLGLPPCFSSRIPYCKHDHRRNMSYCFCCDYDYTDYDYDEYEYALNHFLNSRSSRGSSPSNDIYDVDSDFECHSKPLTKAQKRVWNKIYDDARQEFMTETIRDRPINAPPILYCNRPRTPSLVSDSTEVLEQNPSVGEQPIAQSYEPFPVLPDPSVLPPVSPSLDPATLVPPPIQPSNEWRDFAISFAIGFGVTIVAASIYDYFKITPPPKKEDDKDFETHSGPLPSDFQAPNQEEQFILEHDPPSVPTEFVDETILDSPPELMPISVPEEKSFLYLFTEVFLGFIIGRVSSMVINKCLQFIVDSLIVMINLFYTDFGMNIIPCICAPFTKCYQYFKRKYDWIVEFISNTEALIDSSQRTLLDLQRVANMAQITTNSIVQSINTPTTIRVASDVARWSRIFLRFSFDELTDLDKLIFIEIKTTMHCIYFFFKGNYANLMAWGSNFLITRTEVVQALIAIPCNVVVQGFSAPTADVDIAGNIIHVDAETYHDMVDQFDSNPNNDLPMEYNREFGTQAGVSNLTNLLTTVLSKFHVDGLSAEELRHANNQFAFINHSKRTVSDSIDSAQVIISVIARTLFNVDPFDMDYIAFAGTIVDSIAYVNRLDVDVEAMTATIPLLNEVLAAHKISCQIMLNPRLNTAPRYLNTAFQASHTKLTGYTKTARARLYGSDSRPEPLMIMFGGPPKVGKSAMMLFIQESISHLDGEPYTPLMTYPFKTDSPFWENYHKQKYVVMDDLFMSLQAPMREMESKAIVNMINTVPYPLNMAFDGKGLTNFDSQYVLASTNLIGPQGYKQCTFNIGIADNDAVKRRLHIVLHSTIPVPKNLQDARYKVEKCPIESYVDQSLSPVEIVRMIRRVRTEQLALNSKYKYTSDQLDDLFRVEDKDKVPYDAMRLFMKCVELKIYDWTDSSNYPYYVALFSIVVGSVYAVPFYNLIFPPLESQSVEKDIKEVVRKEKIWNKNGKNSGGYKRMNQQYVGPTAVTTTGGTELNYHQSLITNIIRSMVIVGCEAYTDSTYDHILLKPDGTSYGATCQGFHLRDGLVMTCAHWITQYRECEFLRFFVSSQNTLSQVEDKRHIFQDFPRDAYILDGYDMAIFTLGKTFPRPPAIMQRIILKDDAVVLPQGMSLTLLGMTDDGSPHIRNMVKSPETAPISYKGPNCRFFVEEPITYFTQTERGESGSLLLTKGNNGTVVVLGMHVGGRQGGGLQNTISASIPLLYEEVNYWINDYLNKDDCHDIQVQSGSTIPTVLAPMAVGVVGDFPLIVKRVVSQEMSNHPPTNSSIKQSQLHSWNGSPTMIPARLRTFINHETQVQYNPLYLALGKMIQTKFQGFAMPNKCVQYLMTCYPRIAQLRYVLSIDEALNGVPTKRIPSIRMATSAGYPFNKVSSGRGKSAFIDVVDNRLKLKSNFAVEFDTFLSKVVSLAPLSVIFADNLKDETRDRAKVLIGKSRIISSCPLDFLIAVRMYFSGIVAAIQQDAETQPIAVGLDAHSWSWGVVYSHLNNTYGDSIKGSVLSGDFSNWDGNVPMFVLEQVIEFINLWYDDGNKNAQIRKHLFSYIIQAEHIIYDKVYQVQAGVPSGHPITSILNSLANVIMTFYILNVHFKILETDFTMKVYGDDNIITVKQPGLRCRDLSPWYKHYFGMTYTHFSKTENDEHDTLESIRFIGRAFVDGKYAPLELKTIVESTYWRRGDTDIDPILISTIQSYFIEMSHYPEKTFNKYVRMLQDAVHKYARHLDVTVRAETHGYYYYEDRKYNKNYANFKLPWDNYTVAPNVCGYDVPDFVCHSGLAKSHQNKTESTENREFTERAVKDPVQTQDSQMGGFLDVSQVEHTMADSVIIPEPQQQFNVEVFTMDGVLERAYEVGVFVWGSTAATGTSLGTLAFPDVLFAETFISNKLDDFRLFRAGVRLSIRVNCNQFLYGKLMVTYQPYVNGVHFNPTTIYNASGDAHVLVSANAAEAVIFDVPFVHPNRALNIQDYVSGDMGLFKVWVLNPLININGEDVEATVILHAQFLQPETMVPKPITTSVSSHRQARQEWNDFVVHSGRGKSYNQAFKGNSEAITKVKNNSVSSRFDTSDFLRSAITNTNYATQYINSFGAMMRAGMGVAAMIGLNKPTNTALTSVMKTIPLPDHNYGSGLSLVTKLAFNPENGISVNPNVGGISVDEMNFKKLLGTPMLTNIVNISGTGIPVFLANCYPTETNPSFVDSINHRFGYWSGSFKFKIYITASNFHNAKLVFFLSDDETVDNDYNNLYHLLLDVQGDSDIGFTVTYMSENIVSLNNAGALALYVRCTAWSQPLAIATVPIALNVYKAAADDFQFYGEIDNQFTPTCNPRADFAEAFPGFHKSMKAYHTEGLVVGENVSSVRDILHRYQSYAAFSDGDTSFRGGFSGTACVGMELWGLFYRFWRGSIRVRLLTADPDVIDCVQIRNTSVVTYAYMTGTTTTTISNPMLEFEIPYYSNLLFQSTHAASNITIYTANATAPFLTKSIGDDFSFHWIRALPPGVWATSGSIGQRSMMGFFN